MAEEVTLTDGQRSAAKVLALAFPISMVLVASANFGLRGDLILDGNTAETVRRVAAAQPVFRLSVLFDLLYAVGVIVQLTALYAVLSGVGRNVAILAGVLKLVYAVTAVLIALTSLNILQLSSSAVYLEGFGAAPLHALVELSSVAAWEQYYIGLVFWALASSLFGWLWLRSGYVPSWLAIFGIASSLWGFLCALAYIANPGFSRVVNVWLFDMPMAVYYLALSSWLLFKGLRGARQLL
jgi:hypothetical protein